MRYSLIALVMVNMIISNSTKARLLRKMQDEYYSDKDFKKCNYINNLSNWRPKSKVSWEFTRHTKGDLGINDRIMIILENSENKQKLSLSHLQRSNFDLLSLFLSHNQIKTLVWSSLSNLQSLMAFPNPQNPSDLLLPAPRPRHF